MPVGKYNRDKALADIKEAEDSTAPFERTPFWEKKDGKNEVRILPPPPDDDALFFKTGTHFGVGPQGMAMTCPRCQDEEAECYLCGLVAGLYATKDENDKLVADGIRARRQWLYRIVDIDDVGAGIQIGSFGITIHKDIGTYIKDDDGEYGDITDLEEGTNLVITKTGKGQFGTKYDVRAKRSRSPVPQEILDLLEASDPPNLKTARYVPTGAEMRAAFEGTTAPSSGEAAAYQNPPPPAESVRRTSSSNGDGPPTVGTRLRQRTEARA